MYVVISVYVNTDTAEAESAGAIGPFDSEDAAYDWGQQNWGEDADWFISIISSPEGYNV